VALQTHWTFPVARRLCIFAAGNESSQWDTFAPRNESSRELSLPGTNVRSQALSFLVISSLSDHSKRLAFSSH